MANSTMTSVTSYADDYKDQAKKILEQENKRTNQDIYSTTQTNINPYRKKILDNKKILKIIFYYLYNQLFQKVMG